MGFHSIPLTGMSILTPVPHCLDHGSSVESSPTWFFFLKIILALLSPLQIHMNFRISLSILAGKARGILLGLVLKS